MQCPVCNVAFEVVDLGKYHFISVDVCPKCQGYWFEKGQLNYLDERIYTDIEKIDFHSHDSKDRILKCPNCNDILESLTPKDNKELVIDHCPTCLGFWLDNGELDHIKKHAAKIDPITKDFEMLERPSDWSLLRWSLYYFKNFISNDK